MPSFSPDVKKFPGAASCTLHLLIARFFRWNRIYSGGTLSQSGAPEKLIGLRHFWESLGFRWTKRNPLYNIFHFVHILGCSNSFKLRLNFIISCLCCPANAIQTEHATQARQTFTQRGLLYYCLHIVHVFGSSNDVLIHTDKTVGSHMTTFTGYFVFLSCSSCLCCRLSNQDERLRDIKHSVIIQRW